MGAAAQELAVVVAAAQVAALVALIPVGPDGRDPRAIARLLLLTIAPGMPDLHSSRSGAARHSKGPHKRASKVRSKTVNTNTDCRSRWTAPDTQDR